MMRGGLVLSRSFRQWETGHSQFEEKTVFAVRVIGFHSLHFLESKCPVKPSCPVVSHPNLQTKGDSRRTPDNFFDQACADALAPMLSSHNQGNQVTLRGEYHVADDPVTLGHQEVLGVAKAENEKLPRGELGFRRRLRLDLEELRQVSSLDGSNRDIHR